MNFTMAKVTLAHYLTHDGGGLDAVSEAIDAIVAEAVAGSALARAAECRQASPPPASCRRTTALLAQAAGPGCRRPPRSRPVSCRRRRPAS